VTNAARAPVAHATVTAITPDGRVIRATVSGADGVYSLAELPAGSWLLTTQVDQSPEVTGPTLAVVSGKATRYDVMVAGAPAVAGSPAVTGLPAVAAATAAAPAFAGPAVPEALQAPEATSGVDNFTPFAFGDFTWLNGAPRNHQAVFDTKFFTPDI